MAKSTLYSILQNSIGGLKVPILLALLMLGGLALGGCKTGKPTYSQLKQAFR